MQSLLKTLYHLHKNPTVFQTQCKILYYLEIKLFSFRNLIVVNSTFEGNIADSKDGAGAIYLEDVFNVVISNSSFISNNAETGDGGAIKLKWSVSNCGATLNSNVFKLNQAGTKGGAISWNLNEPQNVLLNTYANNTALEYGDDIGSVVSYLAFITKGN